MTVTDLSKFDTYRFNLLVNKIKNIKADYDPDLDQMNDSLKGFRYSSDERIARLVVGNIYNECGDDYTKANAKFLSLDSTEILPYIKAAVIDSARADYHYAYEKTY